MTQFNPVTKPILNRLSAIVGADNLSTAKAERELRAQDMSSHPAHLSEVVVWPQTAVHTANILQLAHQNHIPVTPWGAGSSLEGNPIPLHGGILLSTERMTAVTAVSPDDFQVTVQPGLGYKDLNKQLAQYGLFFPPDPGANATIGGMLANNAAGARTVKYGATKDNVLQMEVALADGRLIRVGSRSVKQASGYDLLHLFIGSEGTLGVMTEATLQLTPVPTLMSAVVASFPTVAAAIEAVVAVRGSGLDAAALEFIGARNAELLTRTAGVPFGAKPTVFMEFHAAHEASLQSGLEMAREICKEAGATHIQATTNPTERSQLWQARHHLFETQVREHPGVDWLVLDTAVPISAYPALVQTAEQTLATFAGEGYMVGHAGDGNLHVIVSYVDGESYERATAVNQTLVLKAIELGGTATGEHGVGIGKAKFMPREHGPALDVMRQLKQNLDPHGILNPGKIFPASTHR